MPVVLPATLEDIEAAIHCYFRTTATDIRHGRRQSQVYARHVFFYVARQKTRYSMSEIGDHVGATTASVSHAISKLEARMHDATVRSDVLAVGAIVDGDEIIPAGRGHVASIREVKAGAA